MPRILVFLLFLTLSFNISAKEKRKAFIAKDADDVAEREVVPTLTNLDGEPSSFIANAVNVITGNFCETQVDLVIPGPNPISIQRSYASSSPIYGALFYGWTTNYYGKIKIEGSWKYKKHYNGYFYDAHKSHRYISGRTWMEEGPYSVLKIDKETLNNGVSNNAAGTISARSNMRNTKIYYYENKHKCFVKFPDKNIRYFKSKKICDKNYIYKANFDVTPQKNITQFQYDKDYALINRIISKSKDDLFFGQVDIHYPEVYKKFEKNPTFDLTSSDQRAVKYSFVKQKRAVNGESGYFLSQVISPVNPQINYEYAANSHLLIKKINPDNRFQEISYYRKGVNNVGGKKIKISSSSNSIHHRVSMLKAPVGIDDTPIITHRFFYDLRTKYKRAIGGSTEVRDAYDNKTVYRFTDEYRLTDVEKYLENGSLYSAEKLFWGDKKSKQSTDIISRVFQSGDGDVSFCRHYAYDKRGNIVENYLYGDLTGETIPAISIDKNGIPDETKSEKYVTYYEYNDRDLMTYESDGRKKIAYFYFEDRDLLEAKITYDVSVIAKREFYEYDDNGVKVLEIVDDGISLDSEDLSQVTFRKIMETVPTKDLPIGLPEVIFEKYLDLASGESITLTTTVNSFSKEGYLLKRDIYDADNVLAKTWVWELDSFGNVTKEVNPFGQEAIKRYDANNNLIFEQGSSTDYHLEKKYDFCNRLISEEIIFADCTRLTTKHSYDYLGNKIETKDIYGNATRFIYDEFGRLIKKIDPSNAESFFEYDIFSNPILYVDANDHTIRSKYNIRQQPIYTQYMDGSDETRRYTLDGLLEKIVDKNGLITKFSYDYDKRVVRKELITPLNLKVFTFEYDAFNKLSETDAEGVTTYFDYDFAGRLIRKRVGDALIEYHYDSMGRLNKTVEYTSLDEFIVKKFEFDALDRVIDEEEYDGFGNLTHKASFGYDSDGNRDEIIRYTKSGIAKTKILYNAFKKPYQITDALGNVTKTHFRYDYVNAYGQNVPYSETVDPEGNAVVTISNVFGKECHIIKKNILGKIVQERKFFYDAVGNRVETRDIVKSQKKDNRVVVNLFEYDELNREIKRIESFGDSVEKIVSIKYNLSGQKEAVIKPDGVILNFDYDEFGRLERLSSTDNSVDYSYVYDLNDNILEVVDSVYDQVAKKSYDINQRLIREVLANGLEVSYSYDFKGRPIEVILPDQSICRWDYLGANLSRVSRIIDGSFVYQHQYCEYDLDQNLLGEKSLAGDVSYTYDLLNRVEKIESPHFSENIDKYDKAGNVLTRTFSEPSGKQTENYIYDDLYQIIGESGSFEHKYSYDSLHNRLSKDDDDYQVNALNQLLYDGTRSYCYDANGNMREEKSNSQIREYCYDALDRLTGVIEGKTKFQYIYDEIGRRISKRKFVFKEGVWVEEDIFHFLYQGENEVGKLDAQGKFLEFRLLGRGKGSEMGAAVSFEIMGQVYFPQYDHLGHVRALVDNKSQVVETYCYSVYGEEGFSDAISPWRFASKRIDPESGFIFFGKRYYSPENGRWITPDPLGFEGGINLYAFVNNNPANYVDFFGLYAQSKQGGSHSIFCNSAYYIGRLIHFAGDNCIPIPIVRDGVSLTGHLLCRRNFNNFYPLSKAAHSNNYYVGERQGTSKEEVLVVNGIMTRLKQIFNIANWIKKDFGDANIHYTHNATHGIISDLLECAAQIIGLPTRSVDQTTKHMRGLIQNVGGVGGDGRVNVIASSQGGLITYRALQNLTAEEKKMIHVVTVGSAKMISSEGLGSAVNYVNTKDGIPFIADPIGVFKGLSGRDKNINIQMLQSSSKCLPFIDHSFDCENYRKVIQSEGDDFKIRNPGFLI